MIINISFFSCLKEENKLQITQIIYISNLSNLLKIFVVENWFKKRRTNLNSFGGRKNKLIAKYRGKVSWEFNTKEEQKQNLYKMGYSWVIRQTKSSKQKWNKEIKFKHELNQAVSVHFLLSRKIKQERKLPLSSYKRHEQQHFKFVLCFWKMFHISKSQKYGKNKRNTK